MLRQIFILAALAVLLANATQVEVCEDSPSSTANQVDITDCNVPPCILRRGTNVTIQQIFIPKIDVLNLITSVHAIILGVPFPFIGVDGTNACTDIYHSDGSPAECPLKRGETYIYKKDIPVLPLYPKVTPIVTYALKYGKDDVTCFEVPCKIV